MDQALVMQPVGSLIADAIGELPGVLLVDHREIDPLVLTHIVHHNAIENLNTGAVSGDAQSVLGIVKPDEVLLVRQSVGSMTQRGMSTDTKDA